MKSATHATAGRSDTGAVHYEKPTIDTKRTLLSAAVVVATIVMSGVVARETYLGLRRPPIERSSTPLYGEGLVLPAEPRLEGIEMMSATSTANLNAEENRLQNYGWIDREKRIVHIPIQAAMELAIEQGWLRSAVPTPDNRPKQPDNLTPVNESPSPR